MPRLLARAMPLWVSRKSKLLLCAAKEPGWEDQAGHSVLQCWGRGSAGSTTLTLVLLVCQQDLCDYMILTSQRSPQCS